MNLRFMTDGTEWIGVYENVYFHFKKVSTGFVLRNVKLKLGTYDPMKEAVAYRDGPPPDEVANLAALCLDEYLGGGDQQKEEEVKRW